MLAPLSKAHSMMVASSNGSVGNLSDLMQRGRNMVKVCHCCTIAPWGES